MKRKYFVAILLFGALFMLYPISKSYSECVPEGQCVKEGIIMPIYPNCSTECCEGLTRVWTYKIYSNGTCSDKPLKGNAGICTKCGNGECGIGENICNCPADCRSSDQIGKNHDS